MKVYWDRTFIVIELSVQDCMCLIFIVSFVNLLQSFNISTSIVTIPDGRDFSYLDFSTPNEPFSVIGLI